MIEAALPSVKREDVNIELVGNDLAIIGGGQRARAQGHAPSTDPSHRPLHLPRNPPSHVDAEKIDASLSNGVLTVRVPKSERDQRRRIEMS